MLKKVKFIYNPSSGDNVVTEYLDDIIALYQGRGYLLVPHRLDFKASAQEIAGDIDDTYHHCLISGGDGTMNYVINILKEQGKDIPVGMIPSGTANDFATVLGMPAGNVVKACEAILDGEVRSVDLGRVNGRYFVNVFSCGLFTDISQKTPTLIKNNFGKLAYYINGVADIPRFRKMNLSIKTDNGNFEGKVLIFFVFNGQFAGSIPLAYLSEVSDGLLDVIIVKGDTPLEAMSTISKYLNSMVRQRRYPKGIVHIQCKSLHAESERNESTDTDGQAGPSFPIEITCEPAALKIIVPSSQSK